MNDQRARARLRTPPAFVPFSLSGGAATLHGRFEAQAVRRPDAPAVVLASGDVSYEALNRDADRAAAVLDERAASAGPIAMLLPQGYASIVWTLAILKTNRPYAPLDQRLPAPVLREQVDDLAPGAIVAASEYSAIARSLSSGMPVIDDGAFALGHATSREQRKWNDSPDAAAYVFYTSGSTGRPKGVHDSHRNVLHNVLRYTSTLLLSPDDRLSLVQNPSFSGTVSSLFGALLNGAAVVPFALEGDGLAELSRGVLPARRYGLPRGAVDLPHARRSSDALSARSRRAPRRRPRLGSRRRPLQGALSTGRRARERARGDRVRPLPAVLRGSRHAIRCRGRRAGRLCRARRRRVDRRRVGRRAAGRRHRRDRRAERVPGHRVLEPAGPDRGAIRDRR
jgi:hypothetical protein